MSKTFKQYKEECNQPHWTPDDLARIIEQLQGENDELQLKCMRLQRKAERVDELELELSRLKAERRDLIDTINKRKRLC